MTEDDPGPRPRRGRPNRGGARPVALVLAIAVGIALDVLAVTVVVAVITDDPIHITENAAQLLSAVFGGVVAALAAYLGYHAGTDRDRPDDPPERERDPL